MKRLVLKLFLVVLMVMPFASVHAINLDTDGPHILADLMPESVEIYTASRVGADFVAELDAISIGLANKLPASLSAESYTLDDTFRTLFAEEGFDWDELIGLVGKYGAVGVENVNDSSPTYIFMVEITDQTGVEELLLKLGEDSNDMPERQMDGDTIVYMDDNEYNPMKAMITPTHFILTSDLDYSTTVDAPLSASDDFINGLSLLNADNYNSIMYVSESVMEMAIAEGGGDLQEMGVNPEDAGAFVAGFTILDGSTFTVDVVVETVSPVPTSTVSMSFLNALPSSSDSFIVATDLTNVYNSITTSIREAARANDEKDPTADIPLMFNFTGLDLEDDILSWTTGAYGMFFGANFESIISEAMETGSVSNIELDAGIVIEATDVALAQNAAAELGQFMEMAMGSEDGVTITQEDGATSIIVEVPLDPGSDPVELEFVLTATDDFFYFGTRSALDKILAGDTLEGDADFTAASAYFLDNPTSVLYSGSDGAIASTIAPLVIMGPAISNVFDSVLEDLGESSSNSSGDEAPSSDELMLEFFQAYNDILSSMTVTSSIDGNSVIRIRGTVSVNP